MRHRQSNLVTRPDTWYKMRLVCVLFTFENKTGQTDRRTDTTSYRDPTAHLKKDCMVFIFVGNFCMALFNVNYLLINHHLSLSLSPPPLSLSLSLSLSFGPWKNNEA